MFYINCEAIFKHTISCLQILDPAYKLIYMFLLYNEAPPTLRQSSNSFFLVNQITDLHTVILRNLSSWDHVEFKQRWP